MSRQDEDIGAGHASNIGGTHLLLSETTTVWLVTRSDRVQVVA